ncbi:nucleotidyl transferase AbiEii/AbiGii toxin family protein [Streptomyces sp. NBC_01224]|uniref:hypothetical protein n=1 Tax=Streptomyces sp. NBC_01224 TaxID=2903783 RepID=UPI002E152251|nr:nucleotidyl transferase AbiEii/AbiGii toxin family protein [Streptomyces sp. NBC_01224]
MNHPVISEPALQQFANPYQAGEPEFDGADEEMGRAWHGARRTAPDTVLAVVADGPWGRHLVLRGSVLMATWFEEAAREPGDLDFLVVPRDWAMGGPRTRVCSTRSPGPRQPPLVVLSGSMRPAW